MTSPVANSIIPLEQFVERYRYKYEHEKSFRQKVLRHLELTRFQKVKLLVTKGLQKVGVKRFYERTVSSHIDQYATEHWRDYKTERERLQDLEPGAAVLAQRDVLAQKEERARELLESRIRDAMSEADGYKSQVAELRVQSEQEAQRIAQEAEARRIEIIRAHDYRAAAKNIAEKAIARSELTKTDERGNVTFDSARIVKKLEDILLDNFVFQIEGNNTGGFMSNLGSMFEEADDEFEYEIDVMDDLGDYMDIDWDASIALSAEHGYHVPTPPHIMVRRQKPVMKRLGRIGVDTATIIDVSGSMFPERFPYAQQMGLAVNGLMRKLSENNESYLGVYGSTARDITGEGLARYVQENDGTNTGMALDWGLAKLGQSGKPGIVNLITDGEPTDGSNSLWAADRYKNHPNVLLCIYLIDPDEESKEKMREIGQRAGPDTRFLPIPVDRLGRDVIQSISDSITTIYNNQNF
jgi:hypothetical protein